MIVQPFWSLRKTRSVQQPKKGGVNMIVYSAAYQPPATFIPCLRCLERVHSVHLPAIFILDNLHFSLRLDEALVSSSSSVSP